MRRFHSSEADSETNGSLTSRARHPCNTYLRRRQYTTAAAAAGAITLALWILLSTHSGAIPLRWAQLLHSSHRNAPAHSDSFFSPYDSAGRPKIRPLPPGIDPADSSRACPVDFPRPTAEQTASGAHIPYLFGGQSPHCKQCRNDDDWSKFCRVRPLLQEASLGMAMTERGLMVQR